MIISNLAWIIIERTSTVFYILCNALQIVLHQRCLFVFIIELKMNTIFQQLAPIVNICQQR
jgi:hypothetical protein